MNMEPSDSADPIAEPAILFRPSKKRKIYRQRASSPSPPNDDAATSIRPAPVSPTSPGAQTLDELISSSTTDNVASDLSVADILRQRKQHRQRVGGVEFRATLPARANDETALIIREEDRERDKEKDVVQDTVPAGGIIRQFSRQTGLVGDVDKHMMAYIDSELAKRRQPASTNASQPQLSSTTPSYDPATTTAPGGAALPLPNHQPATIGKLQEIDLGAESRSHNVHRTMQALDPSAEPTTPAEKPPKPRIGRNGKPYIPRPRKRRDSDAMRRDALVDQVMSENRIEIYEALPPPNNASGSGNGNGEGSEQADEALEEAFRQEFLDAVASRQRLKKPVQVSSGSKMGSRAKEEEALKGPKLGGSRSARAAMRDRMLAEQKAGKR